MLNSAHCRVYSLHGGGYVASCICASPFTADRSQAALFTPEQAAARAAELSTAGHDHLHLEFGFEVEGFAPVSGTPESASLSGSV
ncbi:MAG: hypothetical protein PHQ05_06535 [Sterolibacterium sp.]|nr:hypothetical protein [Sterolibacterium sp.]